MIAIGSDHNGFELKEQLKKYFEENSIEYVDMGPNVYDNSDDYPVFAKKVAKKVASKDADFGVLICGTGIGMMMTANRFKGVRAVNTHDKANVKRSREHNNSNVLCIGAALIDLEGAIELIQAFVSTPFEGGRHQLRIDMLDQ